MTMERSKYKLRWSDDYPRWAYRLTLKGATNKELAEAFECNVQTIDYWMRTKPKFREAVRAGKERADAVIAEAFYNSAKGYDVTEERIYMDKGKPIVVTVTRHIKGDPWAQKQWLATRCRAEWGDITRIETKNTNINIFKIQLDGLSTEELKLVEKLHLKELSQNIGDN
jgi:hypothetical protein